MPNVDEDIHYVTVWTKVDGQWWRVHRNRSVYQGKWLTSKKHHLGSFMKIGAVDLGLPGDQPPVSSPYDVPQVSTPYSVASLVDLLRTALVVLPSQPSSPPNDKDDLWVSRLNSLWINQASTT